MKQSLKRIGLTLWKVILFVLKTALVIVFLASISDNFAGMLRNLVGLSSQIWFGIDKVVGAILSMF